MRERLPSVMVLEFKSELGHSVWIDYFHRCRTLKGLTKLLKSEVKAGKYVAFRLMHITREEMGIIP